MMKFGPFIYTPDKSIQVCHLTTEHFDKNPAIADRLQKFTWIYHALHDAIPTTSENLFSGHSFPYVESWDELQISFTLCQFGLYKQAMCSLRSGLELGLLSVYYNINDEGHQTVQKWLSSKDTNDADTPKFNQVWRILASNSNITKFQEKIDLRQELLDLGYLHNYIHTKGHKFSNRIGLLKSNWQTFEEKGLVAWIATFEKIVILITVLHLLKYPTTILDYDFGKKFGVDVPGFPHLQSHNLKMIQELFPKNYILALTEICVEDVGTKDFLDWLDGHPDMTDEDVENQIVDMDKGDIERWGIEHYKRNQAVLFGGGVLENASQHVKTRITELEKWAAENGFLEPKFKFPHNSEKQDEG